MIETPGSETLVFFGGLKLLDSDLAEFRNEKSALQAGACLRYPFAGSLDGYVQLLGVNYADGAALEYELGIRLKPSGSLDLGLNYGKRHRNLEGIGAFLGVQF